ncbi:hypothetical protein, partial [[Ruminococcus] lactaris]|uniref:hypothetical protein n=1 Tax=[Ruminococcus] lactaris TaxID=46228 RepID=UPI0023AEB406
LDNIRQFSDTGRLDQNTVRVIRVYYLMKRLSWGFKQSMLMIQSRLQQIMRRTGDKVLLITSTIPAEGKTMTSVNMALALSSAFIPFMAFRII